MPGKITTAEAEAAILAMLEQRKPDTTICPSEVARHLAPGHWRALMPAIRDAARRLALGARLQITQKGRPVDPDRIHGPIRLKLKRP
jgi:hypothetical protein